MPKIGRLGQHIRRLEPFTCHHPREETIIWTNVEFVCLCGQEQRTSRCADPGINHGHEYRAGGEIACRSIEQIRRGADVKRAHCVGEVNELCRWMQAEDGTLELGHIRIACAKIGEQRNDNSILYPSL